MRATSSSPYDAVVVGGGVAGAAASILLAQNGAKVLLLEKENRSHHKVCGEFISHEAVHYLARLHINVLALGAAPINQLQLICKKQATMAALPFQAMSLSRFALDAALLDRAHNEGVTIMRGHQVASIERDDQRWRVTTAQAGTYYASSSFMATGKHDMRGRPRTTSRANDYIGLKMHFRLNETQRTRVAGTTSILLYDGGYAGIEPIEHGLANLCLVIRKESFARIGKSWDVLVKSLRAEVPQLDHYLEGAVACWDRPLAIYGIPYGFVHRPRPQDEPGHYRVGDQIAVIPSLCGDGIAIALHTAFLAARAFVKGDAGEYHTRAWRELSPQINRAMMVSRILASPKMQWTAVAATRVYPALIRNFVTSTRIKEIVQL